MVQRLAWGLLVAGTVAALAGCGGAPVLHTRLLRPAAIPARAYPVVVIAAADEGASRDAVDAIAAHLAGGRTRVARARHEELFEAARRETGPTLALLVTVHVGEAVETRIPDVPSVRCAPGAICYGYPERGALDVRVQIAQLVVTALDPGTEAELGHAAVFEEESEPTPTTAQLAALARVRDAALRLFDVHEELLDVALDDPQDPLAREAIDRALRGDVAGARQALEARLAAPDLAPTARAPITFDLGQLTRLDVDGNAPDPVAAEIARFDAAEQLIVAALRLAPEERYERALAQLRDERAARADVREQARATAVNFGESP